MREKCLGFDSILVRLKATLSKLASVRLLWFRFHTGSIKRLYENRAYIIRDPYETRQVIFCNCYFSGRIAVNPQSCEFTGRLTAPYNPYKTWADGIFSQNGWLISAAKYAFCVGRQQV